ncbi:MAG: 50S ribosomal protein L11 methyltransferase [Sulfurimonas sp.]|jgi:ribosomal protein L11 methyltransferase|nr:50S ribosomal protein L11 methyltransferase [Sulfurimonadaceae bacterium]
MQEYYYKLEVQVSSHKELFLSFLNEIVDGGFEEVDDGFIIRSEDALEDTAWALEYYKDELSKALSTDITLNLNLTKEANQDWIEIFKKGISPIEVDKFYVHPYWDEASKELINITINPALAFGTGHHPTTYSALSAISKYVKSGDSVLDVGCGSGILGIAATKLGAIVDACDTDELSIDNTKQNLELNGVEFHNLWVGSSDKTDKTYDVVIANIVADVLTFIANDLKKATKDSGILILSGILDKYEDKVLKFYKEYEIKQRVLKEEWVTLILSRK